MYPVFYSAFNWMYVICWYVPCILLCFQWNVCNMLVCTLYFTLLSIECMYYAGMYPVFYSAFNWMYVICWYVPGILLCFQMNVCNMMVCTRYFTLLSIECNVTWRYVPGILLCFQLNVCNMLVCSQCFTLLSIECMLFVGMYSVFYSMQYIFSHAKIINA